MKFKSSLLILIVTLLIVGLYSTMTVYGQEEPSEKICGDSKVDKPNDDGVYERCDEGGETESCTAQCGQKLFGWGWGDTFGWLSLNSDNCNYLECDIPASVCQDAGNYYVQVEADTNQADDNLKGWAWSDNIGFVCFGASCDSTQICQFSGGSCNAADYGLAAPANGWRALVESKNENPEVFAGWGKVVNLGDQGWLSLNCDNSDATGGPYCNTAEHLMAVIEKDLGCRDTGQLKKVPMLSGFAWNDQIDGVGLGWVSFDPEISPLEPWLQTKYSDIYSRLGVRSKTGEAPGYNATYLILAKGAIVDFISARGDAWLDPNYGPIDFPTPQTRYSNVLGSLDVDGILCSFIDGQCVNAYSQKVLAIDSMSDLPAQVGLPLNKYLSGNIYYADDSLTIDEPGAIQFTNQTGFGNGAGTIIVNGDLTVNSNIIYDNTDRLTKFRNLASAAWVVKGDLKIGPDVTDLAGNFIVLGDSAIEKCPPDTGDERQELASCGQFYSCYPNSPASCASYPLRVSGLVMAKKFYFDRTFVDKYAAVKEGSEIVIYDGRLLANIPPGLADFAEALPIWRSGTFAP